MAATIKTTEEEVIKAWAAARSGVPVLVDQVLDGYHSQPLRIYFEEQTSATDFDLKPVDWKVFFVEMRNRDLAFAYEENGDDNFFYEFVPAGG
ncbi:MAG: hypothetical protein WBA17_11015 [Saprospiraceae bacterium]